MTDESVIAQSLKRNYSLKNIFKKKSSSIDSPTSLISNAKSVFHRSIAVDCPARKKISSHPNDELFIPNDFISESKVIESINTCVQSKKSILNSDSNGHECSVERSSNLEKNTLVRETPAIDPNLCSLNNGSPWDAAKERYCRKDATTSKSTWLVPPVLSGLALKPSQQLSIEQIKESDVLKSTKMKLR